jgi:hypothetical protein
MRILSSVTVVAVVLGMTIVSLLSIAGVGMVVPVLTVYAKIARMRRLPVVRIAGKRSIVMMLSGLRVVTIFVKGVMRTVISLVRIVVRLSILTILTAMTTGAIVWIVGPMAKISTLRVFGIVPAVSLKSVLPDVTVSSWKLTNVTVILNWRARGLGARRTIAPFRVKSSILTF